MILRDLRAHETAAVASRNRTATWPSRPSSAGWAAPTGCRRRPPNSTTTSRRMRPRLSVNAQTREFIDFLMTSPFFPNLPGPVDRQLHRFAIYAGMSRAPLWARELIGFDRPPALTRRLIEPALQSDARRLRWAFGTPRYVELARERAAGARAVRSPRGDRRPADRGRRRRDRGRQRRRGGRPHQSTHPGRGAAGGCSRWAATDHGRRRGAPRGGFPDDRLPPLPAPRRSGRGAWCAGKRSASSPLSPTPSTPSRIHTRAWRRRSSPRSRSRANIRCCAAPDTPNPRRSPTPPNC